MRLSISSKVFLGFATVLLTSSLVSVYVVVQMRRLGEGLSLVSSRYFPLTRAAASLEAFQKERERSTDRLLEEKDPAARRRLLALDRTDFARVVGEKLQRARELAGAAEAAAAAPSGAPAGVPAGVIEAHLALLTARMADEDLAAAALERALGAPAPPELAELTARLKTAERRVDHELKGLLSAIQDQTNRSVSEAEQQERAARWVVVGLSLLALGMGLVVTWLAQRMLSPIAGLTDAAQRLGRGAPDAVAAVPAGGSDELAVLAREFNAMAQRLAARERELRAQGDALLRSERLAAIGRIAAQITHEIRNPLSSIGLNAEELGERLRGDASDRAQAQALCDAIAREVDRLAGITEEYLRYARLPRPHLARASVAEIVRDLLEFVRPELEAGAVRADLELEADLPPLQADAAQLRQLLLNLVRNAREAMPQGGRVRVRAARGAGGSVVIEVQDSGPGIPPERLTRIFDPFFTTKQRGTGLGLAVSQEIAQEHGGRLSCRSAPGETVFTLSLPAAPEDGIEGPETPVAPALPSAAEPIASPAAAPYSPPPR